MPWTSLLVGWFIKILTRGKLIVDFRDPWVNNPFYTNKRTLLKKAEEFLENKIVTSADIVCLNTEELHKEFLERYYFLPKKKFILLPNGYDEYDFKDINLSGFKRDENQLLLTHTGHLYGLRNPMPIINAIEAIWKKDANAGREMKFRQIGNIDLNYDIEILMGENFLKENYEYLGIMEHQDCLQSMVASDILVIIQQGTKTQIPSKIYEYVYFNKPILTIASKEGALANLILKYQLGDIFEPHDIEGISNYLMDKYLYKKEHGVLKENYKNKQKFNVRNISQKLYNAIEEIA